MISVICPSNKKKVLKSFIESIRLQSYTDYELIIVDTNKTKFNSAIESLNYGIEKAKGDYLMFVHHDVIFEDKDELKNISKYLKEIKEFGIIGVAGKNSITSECIGNIKDGLTKKRISNKIIDKPVEVVTLDEVLFIIKKDIIQKYPLDANNKTWHLYAVEYCLKMLDNKYKVYIIPSNIYHLSDGASMDESYFEELKRVTKIYRKKYKRIYTTIRNWYTNPILLYLQIIKYKMFR